MTTQSQRQRIVSSVVIILIAFAAGMCAGVLMYPELFATQQADAHGDHAHDEEAHAHEDDHLDLTEQAVQNLDLQLGRVELGDYWEQTSLPGEVVEVPGQSDLSVSAPVAGVIEEVTIRDGQSVELGDQLFELRITDPLLTSAQSELLSVLSKLEVNNREIERLRPLASEGIVGQKRQRELEYEVEKLDAQKLTKIQEILARGLPQATVDHVIRTRELAKRILIAVPNYTLGARSTDNGLTKQVGLSGKPSYSIGNIHTHPGQAVQAGGHLCDLSYHGRLYLKGQAFESDVAAINRLNQNNWGVAAEFGHQHHQGHQHLMRKDNLKITRIDNHVSSEGLFSFYIPIDNEVVQEFRSDGRLYQQWQFRPGQRVHLRLPVAKHESKIKVPIDAVAMSGPNAIVFRKHSHDELDVNLMVGIGISMEAIEDHSAHDHDAHAGHDHDDDAHGEDHDDHSGHDDDGGHDHDAHAGHEHEHEEHAFLMLEPVPVHVLHRGHDFVVIDPEGELELGDEIALNAAYKLQLAMQMAAGGGGHGHDHEH